MDGEVQASGIGGKTASGSSKDDFYETKEALEPRGTGYRGDLFDTRGNYMGGMVYLSRMTVNDGNLEEDNDEDHVDARNNNEEECANSGETGASNNQSASRKSSRRREVKKEGPCPSRGSLPSGRGLKRKEETSRYMKKRNCISSYSLWTTLPVTYPCGEPLTPWDMNIRVPGRFPRRTLDRHLRLDTQSHCMLKDVTAPLESKLGSAVPLVVDKGLVGSIYGRGGEPNSDWI